jgi:acyl-CoA synthetase (AMP-forming)/AMP-acid ligase II
VAGPARSRPRHVAVVTGEGRRTFAELDERAGQLGAALRRAGLDEGDRFAVLASNELEYVELQAACLRSGIVMVPLNTRLTEPELAFILDDCAPELIVAGRGFHGLAASLAGPRGCLAIGLGEPDADTGLESYDQFIGDVEPDPERDARGPELTASIIYTSGTTGRPKGVVLDRTTFTARVLAVALEIEASTHDVFLQTLPMFHIGAFNSYAVVARGGTAVLMERYSEAAWCSMLQAHRCTKTVLVPTQIRRLMNWTTEEGRECDTSSLGMVVYGGSSMDRPLLERAMEQFGCRFHQQYGMTETGPQTILRPDDHEIGDPDTLASVGTSVIGVEVGIVTESGEFAEPGEAGEIVCRGLGVMVGYWNRPVETAHALRDGWMHTGDLGSLDQCGYLHLAGRIDDMVVTGGENVYPREVETALAQLPDAGEVAVVGLPDPDWGQVVVAFIEQSAPPEEVLREFLHERLAGYKVPKRWVRVDSFPRNSTGKIVTSELKKTVVS